jgi:hypothetical protein
MVASRREKKMVLKNGFRRSFALDPVTRINMHLILRTSTAKRCKGCNWFHDQGSQRCVQPNICRPEYSSTRIIVDQNIRRPEYLSTRIFANENIPQPEFSSTRIFVNQNICQPEYLSTRIFVNQNICRPEYSLTC